MHATCEFQRAFFIFYKKEGRKEAVLYQKVEQIYHFEFGFLFKDSNIEIIVIDYNKDYVRTIGIASSLENAISNLETCIQYGFSEKGMIFPAVPGYKLNPTEELLLKSSNF